MAKNTETFTLTKPQLMSVLDQLKLMECTVEKVGKDYLVFSAHGKEILKAMLSDNGNAYLVKALKGLLGKN